MKRTILEGKHSGETVTESFDFGTQLAVGETISSASTTAVVYSGTDASPSAIVSGSASISGTVVSQAITAGTAGVTYLLTVTANTSLSQVLEQCAFLTILPATL